MYDAIVIGSGFAGLVVARTIARANKKVVLVEVSRQTQPVVAFFLVFLKLLLIPVA
jgi:choline dehydrogenase-like flavoprotein